MARNEEKNYTILNRLYLENQAKLSKDKHPERPHLNTLSTAQEVKRWIPGIKWEINFCLHHLSGIRNYPDYKIREFQERLEQLKVEYKRWVKRCLELDPDTIGIPGNPHIYHSKKTVQEVKMRKRNVQSSNPNGYTKLYFNIWQVQQAQAQNPAQPPPTGEEGEDGEDVDYPEDGGFDYFDAAGGLDGMAQFDDGTSQLSEDTFETPLAARPEGYTSDEEKSKPAAPADPNDPQNQPLAFSAKKRNKPEDCVFAYSLSNKRLNTQETKASEPETKPPPAPTKSAGLAGLAAYGSDDDE